jgi:putative chitinase
MLHAEQFRQLSPSLDVTQASDLAVAFNETISTFGLESPRSIRYFIAQACFETQGFTKFVENLYYTNPQRLVDVWPSRFSMTQGGNKAYAPDYVKNPAKLANLVYSNRNGNSDFNSGDGYRYRGRGAFHLTGLRNYADASQSIYNDDRLVENPDLVANYMDGLLTAGWFWTSNRLTQLADQDAFTQVTRIINGSAATVKDRLPVLGAVNDIF